MTWLSFLLVLVALWLVASAVVAVAEWVSRRPEREPTAQPGGETRRLLESSRGMTRDESEAYEELLAERFDVTLECQWPGRCECGRCGRRT